MQRMALEHFLGGGNDFSTCDWFWSDFKCLSVYFKLRLVSVFITCAICELFYCCE